jgi:Trk K+ transport system NAD-binding subunit
MEQFLVCGLGSLGQHCVVALKAFGVSVIGINLTLPAHWEIFNIPDLLDQFIIGDSRQTQILEQAKIRQCRAAIIVTNQERINAEIALVIHQLNPNTRLVMRSAQENLNQLLGQHLGNFIAFDPTQLPASAFVLAALENEVLGFFRLDQYSLRIIQRQLQVGDSWCYRSSIQDLNSRTRRILSTRPHNSPTVVNLQNWQPDDQPKVGDKITYIEVANLSLSQSQSSSIQSRFKLWQTKIRSLRWQKIQQQILQFWHQGQQQSVQQVALICGLFVLILLLIGTVLFHRYYPDATLLNILLGVAILLLGGYADLFGEFQAIQPIPWWLQLFAMMLTLAGTALVGVLYALLTQALLTTRFQLTRRRFPVPQKDHIIIIGLGRVGQQVIKLLQAFKQPLVGISFSAQSNSNNLPDIPLIVDNIQAGFNRANLTKAKSVIVVTDDEMLNLEMGLMAHSLNPHCHLVIRTTEQSLSDSLSHLLPKSHVICVYAVAAEAFAAAAFGENILYLFRLDNQTILVTEYQVEAGDTLNNLLLYEVAYGYCIVPILHQRSLDSPKLMPSEDIRLMVGDRLIVLATIEGLKAVEQGMSLNPRNQWVEVQEVFVEEAKFEGANIIVRISGCPLQVARELMDNLPATLPNSLYQHQAYRLVQELQKARVKARIIE